VASVDRRLRKLEARLDARAAAEAAAQEAGWLREVEEVAGRLGTDDLRAVGAVLDDALEALPDGIIWEEEEEEAEASGAAAGPGGDLSDALRALHEVADERGCQALDAALEVLADLRRGGAGEQQQPPKGESRP
jgi:hypothetical protein